ncbi:MAG TPA: BON domain-containing protein [Candidatus Limnocylindrales bacterium]|jgi:hypothetical protein|nr:BON domain-containing protein [Candidatus Limnocylindrales bacterium]
MRISNCLLLIVSIIFAAGCADRGGYAGHPPRYYGLVDTDQALERKLRAQLSSNAELSSTAPDVLISAQNGTVTLSGNVPSEQVRRQIDDIVRNTSGVDAVNDQLQPPYTPTGDFGRPPRVYTSPPQ